MVYVEMFVKYDLNVMNSYDLHDWVEETFGENFVDAEEVRDHRGVLTGLNVTVKKEL